MIYLEMARDEAHGGGTWEFPNCVWAPTQKQDGGSWPFWNKVLQIRKGDIVIHLRGIKPHASFVGYSIASGDGFETALCPPEPKDWSFSKKFYRADISGFTPFDQPVNLNALFSSRRSELEAYFDKNKGRGTSKLNLFYVRQGGHLQCLNGAYLSDVDEELLTALFGTGGTVKDLSNGSTVVSVETGSQLCTVRTRLGQSRFAEEIKKLYGNRCCFPGCQVSDSRFLIGSHIARWSDNEALRGHMGNGLCLCLTHDKAFEIGYFTLDEEYRIFVNPKLEQSKSSVVRDLLAHQGNQITLSAVTPIADALREHRLRVDIKLQTISHA